MLKSYIDADGKIINAEPKHRGVIAGFQVVNSGGYSYWVPERTFYLTCRLITREERQLLSQTTEEAQVSMISDGKPEG